MQVPAYVPSHIKDLPTLGFCTASLQAHPQISTVTVIAARELEPHCADLGVGFIDELDLVVPWFEPGGDPTDRWYYQMVLKLSIAAMPDAPERFLTVDADSVFLNPFRLFDEQTGAALHPRMSEHFPQYYVGVRSLLGRDVTYDGSYIAHFLAWRPALVQAMLAEFARVQGRPAQEGWAVLREFLATCDPQTRRFSEPDTYGHFVEQAAPDEFTWVARRQLNVLYVAPTARVIERLRPYYDYCNFHAYRQSGNPALRAAGATWLAQRLLRDRADPAARRSSDRVLPAEPGESLRPAFT